MAAQPIDEGGILQPERWVPVPTTISPQAQDFLRNPMFKMEVAYPALDDVEGWRNYAAMANAGLTQSLRARCQEFPAETTTHSLSASQLYEVAPAQIDKDDRAILYIHGGAFIVGGGEAARLAAMQIAGMSKIRAFSIDYRMPPDHPYPTPLDDTFEAYRWLLDRYKPENIAFYGGSAGANLAVACALKARDEGLPLPGACILHSPGVDLTQSGDSFVTNTGLDVVLKRPSIELMALYAGGHDLRDPLLSPVFADFSKGFPPTIMTSGTRDLLLSPTVMLHRALRRAGIRAELHVWEAMTHGLFHNAPEAQELLAEHIRFMREALKLD
jgi:acetyl esterase/lipase